MYKSPDRWARIFLDLFSKSGTESGTVSNVDTRQNLQKVLCEMRLNMCFVIGNIFVNFQRGTQLTKLSQI